MKRSAICGFLALLLLLASSATSQSTAGLDAKVIRSTIESTAAVIEREYVDAEVADHIAASLREWNVEGRYDAARTPLALATFLTSDLMATSHDKHLFVVALSDSAVNGDHDDLSRKETARHSNFGVQQAEILGGNVGYLNLTFFYRPEEAHDALVAAMSLLANADSLILDLRANGGGSPDTAMLLMNYIFNKDGLPLFDVTPRTGQPHAFVTQKSAVTVRDADRPVYVLTSSHTWSAGEGVAFLLQERHRAEVIGETTVGAANPGRTYHVGDLFEVNVPNGKVSSAVLGRNWEGSGVLPDVKVPAADSLRAAHVQALRHALGVSPKGYWHNQLGQELQALEAQPSAQ
jgi:hypothetical protein